MTFYKLQNSLKSPPRMQEMACQGLYISKFSRRSMPPEAGPPYRFLVHSPPPGKNKTLCLWLEPMVNIELRSYFSYYDWTNRPFSPHHHFLIPFRACLHGQKFSLGRGVFYPRLNFYRVFIIIKKSCLSTNQFLTNHIKALSQAGESKCLHEEKLSRAMGSPYLGKRLTLYPRVTLGTTCTWGKCEMCHINTCRQGKVKWMPSWLTQGSSGDRVSG